MIAAAIGTEDLPPPILRGGNGNIDLEELEEVSFIRDEMVSGITPWSLTNTLSPNLCVKSVWCLFSYFLKSDYIINLK